MVMLVIKIVDNVPIRKRRRLNRFSVRYGAGQGGFLPRGPAVTRAGEVFF